MVQARFEAEYRVRFDETDRGGLLRSSGYLRFAQDAAWLAASPTAGTWSGPGRCWAQPLGTCWS